MFCQSLNLPPSPIWLFIWQPSGWESESFSCRVTWRRHPERSTGYGWTSSRQAPTTTTAAGVGRRGAAAEAADQLLSPLLPLLHSLSDHLLRRGTGSISFLSYYHLLPAFRQLHKHSSEVSFICDIFGREALIRFIYWKLFNHHAALVHVTVIPVYIEVCCCNCSQLLRNKDAVL